MATLALRAAQATAAAVVLWMIALQFWLTPSTQAPWALFVVFLAAWAWAFVMLLIRPGLGAPFEGVLGLASVFGTLSTHASGYENVVLIGLSAAATVAGVVVTVKGRAA